MASLARRVRRSGTHTRVRAAHSQAPGGADATACSRRCPQASALLLVCARWRATSWPGRSASLSSSCQTAPCGAWREARGCGRRRRVPPGAPRQQTHTALAPPCRGATPAVAATPRQTCTHTHSHTATHTHTQPYTRNTTRRYDVLLFSKPVTLLALLSLPVVKLQQLRYVSDSAAAVASAVQP